MSAKLWVGNLSLDTTAEDIRELFCTVGVVESCQLIEDEKTGLSKGFAFVVMNTLEAAYLAKEKFNGHELHGKALKVQGANPRNELRNDGDSNHGSRRN